MYFAEGTWMEGILVVCFCLYSCIYTNVSMYPVGLMHVCNQLHISIIHETVHGININILLAFTLIQEFMQWKSKVQKP